MHASRFINSNLLLLIQRNAKCKSFLLN